MEISELRSGECQGVRWFAMPLSHSSSTPSSTPSLSSPSPALSSLSPTPSSSTPTHLQSSPRPERRRDRETAAEAVLLEVIFGHPVQLEHEPSGEPFVAGFEGHISISHSRDTLLIAVASRPIGVDIETLSPRVLRVREKFLSPAEIARLGDDVRAVMTAWCQYEALYKLTGILDARPEGLLNGCPENLPDAQPEGPRLYTLLNTDTEVAVLATY